MNDLRRIEQDGNARGIKTSQNRGDKNQGNCPAQYSHRPVKANRPAERLLVDDKNQNQRESESEHNTRNICQQTKESGFRQNHFADLSAASSQKTQQTKLSLAVNHKSEQRPRYSHDGHKNRDRFERVGNRECLIKDLDRLAAKVGVGKYQHAIVRRSSFNFFANSRGVRSACDVNGKIGWRVVGKKFLHRAAIHQDKAAFAPVIVVDIRNAEGSQRRPKAERDRVALLQVVFISERLAHDDGIAAAQLLHHFICWTAREKVAPATFVRAMKVSRRDGRRNAFKINLIRAQAVDRLHSRQCGELLRKLG